MARNPPGADRESEEFRGGHPRPGRPRALREVLPRLHAETVEAPPPRARRLRLRTHPHPHQPRRPLPQGRLPSAAQRRLHRDVRAHGRGLRRPPRKWRMADGGWRSQTDFRRSGIRYHSFAIGWPAILLPARHAGQLPQRPRLHPDRRDQARHRAADPQHHHRPRIPGGFRPRQGTLLSRAHRRLQSPLPAVQSPRRRRAGRHLHRPPCHLPLLQYGSGRRNGVARRGAAGIPSGFTITHPPSLIPHPPSPQRGSAIVQCTASILPNPS